MDFLMKYDIYCNLEFYSFADFMEMKVNKKILNHFYDVKTEK